jgi:Protein of unknown function (DUF4238)
MAEPQQQHYIPDTYLRNFCNPKGTLWVYDKWTRRSFATDPKKALRERFYYAQPDYENKKLNHNIEHFFSRKVEGPWPRIIEALAKRERDDRLRTDFYTFLIALKVRVPNARKSIEYCLQQQVRIFSQYIDDANLPSSSAEILRFMNQKLGTTYRNIDDLYEAGIIDIKIDPHRSLLAMVDLAKGFGRLFERLEPRLLVNETGVDFNTNDNPVIYFPADETPEKCRPYRYRPNEPFELIFPITKTLCLYHHSLWSRPPHPFSYMETRDIELVRRANSFTCAFADRYIVSSSNLGVEATSIPNTCPRPVVYRHARSAGELVVYNFELGKPLKLPKWEYNFSRDVA